MNALLKPYRRTFPPYDPNNLHPLDEEARKLDPDDGIDYDEIIREMVEDFNSGNLRIFSATDYPTDESLIEALEASYEEFCKNNPE
jgi:hypothetical protein